MSSNKTIVPGMEADYGERTTTNHIAGMPQVPQSASPSVNGSDTSRTIPVQTRPIVGFLYSISRTGSGEFWPLHIGSNSIGRSASCDICLPEGTVSEQHAILVVRQMKNPEKVIASICDSSSTIGTMLNGESLGFDQRECFSGDVLTIGAHYDLYLTIIDARQIGLKVCGEFIPVNMTLRQSYEGTNPYAAPQGGFSPGRTRSVDGMPEPSQTGSTQGFNGQESGFEIPDKPQQGNPGGRTIFM